MIHLTIQLTTAYFIFSNSQQKPTRYNSKKLNGKVQKKKKDFTI